MGKYTISLTGGGNTKSHSIAANGGRNTSNHKIHPKLNSFAEIQAVVRAGLAKEYFDIGQELMTHYTYVGTVYNMPWVVLDNDRACEWPDGSKHPGLWIMSKHSVPGAKFDEQEREIATEETAIGGLFYCGIKNYKTTMLDLEAGSPIPYNEYTDVYHNTVNSKSVFSRGYNRYFLSAIRQWLNSDALADQWWQSQHIGDSPEDGYGDRTGIPGFMACLDKDFLSVINPVKIQVAANTLTDGGITDVMYDRFFLQSVEEVYGVSEASGIEGPYFPYWKNATGLDNPSNGSSSDTNNARKISRVMSPTGNIFPTLLRSTYRGTASELWAIDRGYISYIYSANNGLEILPTGVIS